MARWIVVALFLFAAVTADDTNTTSTTPQTTKTTTVTTTTPTTTPTTTTTQPTTTTKLTTTTAAPVTTVKPTPAPAPWPKNVGTWFVNDTETNLSCLILRAALEINVPYTTHKNVNKTASVIVPAQANATGTCGGDTVVLTLTWNEANSHNDQLDLTFAKISGNSKLKGTEKEDHFALTILTGKINPNFTDQMSGEQISLVGENNLTLFETPLNQSYKCTKETSVKLENDIELKVASLQVEAFRVTNFTNFNAELECTSDDVSAVVPFAVGASLALLVVIVLIAYLIGRRRSRARGYQSV